MNQSRATAAQTPVPGLVSPLAGAIFSKLFVVRVLVSFGKQKQNTFLITLKGNIELVITWKAPSLAHSKNLINKSYYETRLSVQP